MAASLALTPAHAFRPQANETLFCTTLVVGDTVAAYTATLAILQAGGAVCWVKPGVKLRGDFPGVVPFSSLTGRGRSPLAPEYCSLSRSQRQFWAAWIPTPKPPSSEEERPLIQAAKPSMGEDDRWQRAIAPYLSSQQLTFISEAVPVQVLYAQERQRRRVYQVVFRQRRGKTRFSIHSGLTLDATQDGGLTTLLDRGGVSTPVWVTLEATHILPSKPGIARGACFDDSIAVVYLPPTYPLGQGQSRPFTLPLGSMIPKNTDGFLRVSQPGSTLSPEIFQAPTVQWALGEAAGHVAALAAGQPKLYTLLAEPAWIRYLQGQLTHHGIPIFGFDDISHEDPDFEAIQVLAISGIVRTMKLSDLHFRPQTPVTRAVAATALMRLLGKADETTALICRDVARTHWAFTAIQGAIACGAMSPLAENLFFPSRVLSRRQLYALVGAHWGGDRTLPFPLDEAPARRRDLSRLLYPLLRHQLGLPPVLPQPSNEPIS